MTQPPLPPQMPPPEPLDESERALARALRNLPVGAPPPELDARILGAARRAVHLAPPRKRNNQRWIAGIGTAASALLAIGLFMKNHGPSQEAAYAPPAESTASASANAPAAAAAPAAMKERAEPQAAADAMAPTGNAESARSGLPAAPMPQQESTRTQQAVDGEQRIATKPVPQAFPVVKDTIAPPPPPPPPARHAPAPAPPVVLEESVPMAAPAPPASPPPPMQAADELQEHKAEQDFAARRDAAVPATTAPASQATGGAAFDQPALGKTAASNALKSNAAASGAISSDSANATETSKDKALDRVDVAGSSVKRAGDDRGAMLPPIDDDARLSPRRWIERIRARVDAADGDGARESLRRFHARYPGTVIPSDLRPLLH